MTVSLIWAQNELGVIGADGGIPWDVPEDLAWFQKWTHGNTVLMGRKTQESLGLAYPLPGRANITVSRRRGAPFGPHVFNDLERAVSMFRRHELFVIGGASIYRDTLHLADRLIVTEVKDRSLGDAYAPVPSFGDFTTKDTYDWETSRTGVEFRHVIYTDRKQ